MNRIALIASLIVASAPASATAPEQNLLSWGAGAMLVETPAEHSDQWGAHYLLDDDPSTGWSAPEGAQGPYVTVIELADPSTLSALVFDIAQVDPAGSGAQHVRAELAAGVGGPWASLGEFVLQDGQDRQRFAFAPATGRYLRITVSSNHGDPAWTELMGVSAYGTVSQQVDRAPVTGAFSTQQYGTFRLQQNGQAASGCYEHDGGLIENGGFDGRVLRFVWTETNGTDSVQQRGNALMVFSDDGARFSGYWWDGDAVGRPAGFWTGRRESGDPGSCPHWTPADNGVEKALAAEGRARLYGILFDTDSDRIRADSTPTIDALSSAARDNPAWTLSIEGHTDNSGSPAHNADLSRRRAEAVRARLVEAGIDPARLNAVGHASDRPVADNATTAGRSQNRRVEVVRLP